MKINNKFKRKEKTRQDMRGEKKKRWITKENPKSSSYEL